MEKQSQVGRLVSLLALSRQSAALMLAVNKE
jgi:hypothetical protein